jgi:hypothetical protein
MEYDADMDCQMWIKMRYIQDSDDRIQRRDDAS